MSDPVRESSPTRPVEVVPHEDYHQNRYAAMLAAVVRPGDRWLDLGAGVQIHKGWMGTAQEELVGRASLLIGCDLVQEHIARNPFLTARLLAGGEHLPLADNSVELVTANMVVEHLPDPVAVFKEVRRVLRPGGRFVFVTPNRTHPVVFASSIILHPAWRRALAVYVERRSEEHVFLTFYRANTATAVRRVAAAAGLEVEHAEAFSSLPFAGQPGLLQSIEGSVIRVARRPRFAFLRSNLLGCLRRPA